MKRWLSNLATALSLLVSLTAVTAWAASHARPSGWRLVAVAHSEDLTRMTGERGTLRFTTSANRSSAPEPGFWDAGWVLSRAGRLTLLTQVIDYQGTLRLVLAPPPSLIVEPPGQARAPAVVFGSVPEAGPWSHRLGFARHSDLQRVVGADGPISARAWMVTVPYWFIALLGIPLPLSWLRDVRRRHHTPASPHESSAAGVA